MSNTSNPNKAIAFRRAICLIIILELICLGLMTREVYSLSNAQMESAESKAVITHILSAAPTLALSAKATAAPMVYEEEHRWKGPVLTKSRGTITGPSGKETYYNLNMNGVVRIMRRMGNEDEYWVRDDGVKMLGDYVMVAANLSIRPRGSLVETSLGTGIVCDTGTFVHSNPTQIDVAVAW